MRRSEKERTARKKLVACNKSEKKEHLPMKKRERPRETEHKNKMTSEERTKKARRATREGGGGV